ncbi:hypothetical protein DYE49_11175 [Treponema rectale]|uniref:Fibronectin type-III domain-containing protein n=1 Tax=Treponema rectale TaxID=744512 RepID=A0A840SIA5_9SPIR|nr:fibronectin type III domain-containing protein [Treponema rectale]MBB5219122.1 hypothetical protein [Treponema rectale]QOS40976.1 hypothetical protein DYE49_11175 [Treponema rectale]
MKKYSIIKAFTASLAAAALFCVTACNNDATEFVPTVAKGLEISSINLSASSVVLSGTSGITTKDLSADIYPSYATNTTVYWSSSDDSIVTVSSETGTSVTLTLIGKGTAVVTARSESGVATASCKVICELETTAPDTVSAVTVTANANNVYFEWTDPVDYDSDLDHIRIESNSGEYTEVAAGLEYGWVKGLSSGTEYNFTLTAIDLNGNASVGYQISATTETVAEEFTAESVTNPTVSKLAESITVTWAADSVLEGSEEWNHMDLIIGEEVVKQLFYTSDEISYTFEGLTAGDEYVVTAKVYNDDFDCLTWTDTVTTDNYVATIVCDDSVSADFSGYLPVKLSDISDEITYSKVQFVLDDVDETAGTATTKVWTGLTVFQEYSVYAKFLDASDNVIGVSNTLVMEPLLRLVHLINGGNKYLQVKDGNVVAFWATDTSNTYTWALMPSLANSDNEDQFSLMSVSGDAWLVIDATTDYSNTTAPSGGWTDGANDTYVMILADKPTTEDGKKLASFTKTTAASGDDNYFSATLVYSSSRTLRDYWNISQCASAQTGSNAIYSSYKFIDVE